jgi:uncharacterized protein YbjQ (UPF0145 family)
MTVELIPACRASDVVVYRKSFGLVTACKSTTCALHGVEDTTLDAARTLLVDKAAKLGANTVLNVTVTATRICESHGVMFTLTGLAVEVAR